MTDIRRDLARNTLAIACIAGLIARSLWVLRPFLAATVWAARIVVATWPLFTGLEARFGGRRTPAVLVMTLAMLTLLVLPLWLAIDTIADHADQLTAAAQSVAHDGIPLPPDWVAGLPLIGEKLAEFWRQLAAAGPSGIVAKITPYAADTGKWALAQVGGLGGMLIQFMLVVTVTAIVQTVLGGIGLAVAGVPFASLLSALMLMFCIAQIGPMLVLLPAVGWMYWSGDTGWATALLVWSLIVGTLDNFLRPMLIKRGADLPLLLIFAGVIGGMLGFGLIGIFVGPVVLAVTYTLMLAWIEDALGKDEVSDSSGSAG